ncbi:ATP-binding cassette domain-containing protein [Isoptericola sp. AK164]|uniref:ABC transporter ATP-binding protein/permease n=1 Tax=Isoptericola sp. AK164 TaxID=3024246 RepID=UPI002418A150|nr:ATP-binding cassette domain-containing protein [Isoptericola sp. AK164]
MIHLRLLRLTRSSASGQAWCVAVGLVLSALAITQAIAMSRLFAGILDGADLTALASPFALLAAALLLRPAATALRELTAHAVAGRMKRDLRAGLLDADAARGPFARATENLGGRHSQLVDGVENLEPYVTRYVPQVVVTTVTAVVTVALLVAVDPVVGLAAGLTAALVPLLPRLWDRALRSRGDEHWDAYAGMHADVVDSMRGMETLKLLGAAGRRREHLVTASARLLHSTLRQLRLSLVESGLTGFLLVAGPALVLAVGVLRVDAGAMAAPALFTVTLVGFEVFRPFRDLANHWHAGYLGVSAGSRLLERLAEPDDTEPPAAAGTAPGDPAVAVALDHVRARYPGAERPAVEDLTLHVTTGSVTAVVGPSGAGKSTVANLVLGLLPPETGTVAVRAADGVPPVTLVSQEPVLFAGTLRENLALVAPGASDAELVDALDRAQAPELAGADGAGLDAEVGEGGTLLSGGQRQRVAVARALLRRSPVLVLDEASSALDADRERRLLTALRTGADAPTLLIIGHRLSAVRDADRIVVVDSGRVVEAGTWDQLLALDGTFARLHAAQTEEIPA